MAATSAQDNFAKWAKIRREHDRALARHDELGMYKKSNHLFFFSFSGVQEVGRPAPLKRGYMMFKRVDGALTILTSPAAKNNSFQSKFNSYASATRWVSTNGLRLFLQFWHARTAVFRLPAGGWVPGWLEWVVGLPRAQGKGGVSVQVWGWVCVVVISLVSEGVVWVLGQLVKVRQTKGEEIKMGGVSTGGGGAQDREAKKSQ